MPTSAEIEAACRALCGVYGVGPDMPAQAGEPFRVGHWGYVIHGETFPAWMLFHQEAITVLEARAGVVG